MVKGKIISVILIDDHPVVRAGYRRLLESVSDICVLAEAGDGESGYALYKEHRPDVVVLDLKMPGIDGLETLRRIKSSNSAANILVFSMYSNEVLVQRTLQAGATGYLTKQVGLDQMIKAIRKVSEGQQYIDQQLPKGAGENIFSGSPEDIIQILTKREFQLFKLLAEGNTIKEIAEILSISPKTVGVHHVNIMKKLKLHTTAQLVHLAIRCNIIL